MFIRQVYVFFIGVLLATFIGVGVAAFYEGPKSPEYPMRQEFVEGKCNPTAEELQYEKDQRAFMEANKIYSRNISIITIIFAVAVLVISLTLLNKLQLISDGLLLGGLFTELYSIIRGFESEDNLFRFVVVAIGLATSLIVGYLKFIKPSQNNR